MNARRLLVLGAMAVVVAVVLSGCTGPVPPTPPPTDTEVAVGTRISEFEAAVEAYNVSTENGLPTFFVDNSNGFVLTIKEAGQSYGKTYSKLVQELQDDADNQAYWRAEHGYQLDLVLGTATFVNATSTGATVVQTFVVYERADGFARRDTDSGRITWEWIKTGGVWKINSMTIEFEPSTLFKTGGGARNGLGFGGGVD